MQWSNSSLLKSIQNPTKSVLYVMTIRNPEVTFLGDKEQPDFARVKIEYSPDGHVIELKSLKKYFYDFRNRLMSYERFITVIFTDLTEVYQPCWLRVTAMFNPRGGIRSTIFVDSTNQTKGGLRNEREGV